jgi:hypothetical protein
VISSTKLEDGGFGGLSGFEIVGRGGVNLSKVSWVITFTVL